MYLLLLDCSDKKCGTCLENSSECDIPCDPTCSRCNTDGSCKNCEIGKAINSLTKKCENCTAKCDICD